MRVLLQRVTEASVSVGGRRIAAIGPGLLVLCGVAPSDGDDDRDWLARKIVGLRVFDDDAGVMNDQSTRSTDRYWPSVSSRYMPRRGKARGHPTVRRRPRRLPDRDSMHLLPRWSASAARRWQREHSVRTCRSRWSTMGPSAFGSIRACANRTMLSYSVRCDVISKRPESVRCTGQRHGTRASVREHIRQS